MKSVIPEFDRNTYNTNIYNPNSNTTYHTDSITIY